MADSDKGASPYHQRGTETVRDTAKWLVVALASIGAAIIVGLQLTDLRNLAPLDVGPIPQILIAVGGVVLGLGGVAGALHATVAVLTPLHVTLDRLKSQGEYGPERTFFENNTEFLRGYGNNVGDLKDRYDTLHQAYIAARNADEAGSTNQTKNALERAASQFKGVHDATLEVLRVASYEHIRRLFLRKLPCVFFCASIAASGSAAFAWATGKNPEADPASLVGDRVTVELRPSAIQKVQGDLGLNCDAKSLDAVVLSQTGAAVEVLVLPLNQCSLLRLAVPASAGKVRAATMIDRKAAE